MAKLDIGDAILTFYGDTNILDAALAGIASKTQAALDPAVVSANNLAQTMVNTGQAGSTLADAIKLITPPFQQSDQALQNMAFSLRNVAPASDEAGDATGRMSANFREARGEVMLLGEATGIHLPRHVASFVASMPGIQSVLQGAFAATAVLFLIDALVKGIEKFKEWQDESHQLQLAQDAFNTTVNNVATGLEDKFLRAQIQIDELRGNHLEALRKELELIDHQQMQELQGEFQKIAQAADLMFAKLKSDWLGLRAGSEGAKNALTDFQAQYDLLLTAGKKDEASALLAGTLKSAKDMQKAMTDANAAADKLQDTVITGGTAMAPLMNRAVTYTEKQIEAQKDLVLALEAQQNVQVKLDAIAGDNKQVKGIAEYNRALQDSEKILKANASEQQKEQSEDDKLREQRRNELIANLQQDEREKIDATKAGSQARLAVIDAAIKEEEAKGLQETGFYKSLVDERIKLVQSMADAELKIFSESQAQQLKQAAEDAKLELGQIQENYHAREDAVKQLASMGIISEQQKNKRLVGLFYKEEKQALAILKDQLSKQQALVEAAQKRETAAQGNPMFSDTQVAELKKNLATAENAVKTTETEITKVSAQFEKERLANEKGAVGQAIAIATAAGKEQLALDLQKHQAMLLAIQDEIALANARGQDTNALKAQQKEIQNATNALVREAQQVSRLRQAWEMFSSEFQQGADLDAGSAKQMADSFKTAVDGMARGIQDAFSAMITGSESAGEAIEKAMFKTIASIAQQWAKYYLAQAIADSTPGPTFDPGGAAGMYAAAAGLEALAGVMGGLGSGSSKSSTTSSSGATIASDAGTTAGGAPSGGINVPKLADGGLVMSPTLAMVGDAPGGKAIIPLPDTAACASLAAAMGGKMQMGAGNGGPLQIHLQSDIPLTVRKITRQVNKGQARLLSSNSKRVTRRSV